MSNSLSNCCRSDSVADLLRFEFDSQRADQLDFAKAVGGAELVFGDAVGVQAAREGRALEDGHLKSALPQLGCAGERSGAGADAGDFLRALHCGSAEAASRRCV